MSERAVSTLTFIAAVGSGIVGGVLLAFSTFVMAALARLPASQGIAAMQAINVTVINPVFMSIFLGTGVLCLALAASRLVGRGGPEGTLIMLASVVYLAGCLGVTMAFNVPLNNALAALPANASEAASFWPRFVTTWTLWNHVRTVAAVVAAVGLTFASRGLA